MCNRTSRLGGSCLGLRKAVNSEGRQITEEQDETVGSCWIIFMVSIVLMASWVYFYI